MQLLTGRHMRALLLVLTLFAGGGFFAFAQGTNGSLTGQVTDPSDAAIIGASVTLTNMGTNSAQTISTDSTGVYLFKLVPPGNYILATDNRGIAKDAIGDQLRMLDEVGRMTYDTRHQYLAGRHLDLLPGSPFVLMSHVAGLEGIGLRLNREN